MFALTRDQIGGGKVRRAFKSGEEMLLAGVILPAEKLLAMPFGNLRALVENRFIEIFPKVDRVEGGQRFLVHRGGAKYDVYFGVKVNDEPLSKDAAEELVKQAF